MSWSWKMARAVTIALAILACARGAAAQSTSAAPRTIPLTVQAGIPISIELEKPVRIKNAGVPISGRVLEPVYVFDRMVIPRGAEVEGRVTKIEPLSRRQRVRSAANGNFTPFRKISLAFDTLQLQDGKRLSIDTAVSPGDANVIHLVAGGEKKKNGVVHEKAAEVREQIHQRKQETLTEIKAPGKWKRLEGLLSAELPYHRQVLPAGMRFTAELKVPLDLGSAEITDQELERMGSEIPPASDVHVWLATPLSSANDHKGAPVEAVVSEPVFTPDHHLILPEGSRLKGQVITAKPARRMGRNGQLRFAFQRIELPKGATRNVEAGLEGVDVPSASHVKLDAEGGAHAVNSKTKYLAPAISVLLATSSMDGMDSHDRAVQEGSGDPGETVGGGVRGGAGFGLVGSVIALAARSGPVTAGFAFYGAAWSVYSHLVARGREVVFPKDTAMEIRFGSHEGPKSQGAAGKASSTAKAPPPRAS
jgi:hypothetical protein